MPPDRSRTVLAPVDPPSVRRSVKPTAVLAFVAYLKGVEADRSGLGPILFQLAELGVEGVVRAEQTPVTTVVRERW